MHISAVLKCAQIPPRWPDSSALKCTWAGSTRRLPQLQWVHSEIFAFTVTLCINLNFLMKGLSKRRAAPIPVKKELVFHHGVVQSRMRRHDGWGRNWPHKHLSQLPWLWVAATVPGCEEPFFLCFVAQLFLKLCGFLLEPISLCVFEILGTICDTAARKQFSNPQHRQGLYLSPPSSHGIRQLLWLQISVCCTNFSGNIPCRKSDLSHLLHYTVFPWFLPVPFTSSGKEEDSLRKSQVPDLKK